MMIPKTNPFSSSSKEEIDQEIAKTRAAKITDEERGTILERLYQHRTRLFPSPAKTNVFDRRQNEKTK